MALGLNTWTNFLCWISAHVSNSLWPCIALVCTRLISNNARWCLVMSVAILYPEELCSVTLPHCSPWNAFCFCFCSFFFFHVLALLSQELSLVSSLDRRQAKNVNEGHPGNDTIGLVAISCWVLGTAVRTSHWSLAVSLLRCSTASYEHFPVFC